MDNSLLIQKQIKDNTEDLHNFVRDLKLWEEEMKRKDRQLSNDQTEEVLPPIRRPKLTNKPQAKKEEKDTLKKKRIPSYDYKSWEKFDVDKACEEVDNENDQNENQNEETPIEDEKYLKEKALYEKELGNKHVKANKWDEAIECYTKAITAYPKDPVFFANRALCYLKKKKYQSVESDCTESLKLDPTYVKAMLRRAAAREALDRLEDARHDLRSALQLEPNNPQAQRDLTRLQNMKEKKISSLVDNCERNLKEKEAESMKATNQESFKKPLHPQHVKQNKEHSTPKIADAIGGTLEPDWEPCNNTIEPILKPPHLRSKKSLKRLTIHDVGKNTSPHVCARKVQTSQEPIITPIPIPTTSTPSTSEPKPRSILTIATPAQDIPPIPSTSVQFHKSWSCIKRDPHLCYRFLKQIPGENLPDIFKDSLESGMFSNIVQILASEFVDKDEPVLSYIQGLSGVRRFSTLALFMSPVDKTNLTKLFDHCSRKKECSQEEINQLRKVYEMS